MSCCSLNKVSVPLALIESHVIRIKVTNQNIRISIIIKIPGSYTVVIFLLNLNRIELTFTPVDKCTQEIRRSIDKAGNVRFSVTVEITDRGMGDFR